MLQNSSSELVKITKEVDFSIKNTVKFYCGTPKIT